VIRSARWPGSVTLSTSAAASLGSRVHQLHDPLGDVLQVHHQGVELDVGGRRVGDRPHLARAQERLGAVEAGDLEAR
jgi:hypothetical protein